MVQASAQNEPAGAIHEADNKEFSLQSVHLLRTAQLATLTLSQMADQKANILTGATFVVFSLVVSQTFNDTSSWTMVCLAATAFLAAFFAVLAIMPRASGNNTPKERINPLFFGHFASADEDQWTDDMLQSLQSDEQVFRLMLHDMYQNGQVLHRSKYRYLSIAYRIFLGGLGITLAVYLAENLV